METIKVIIKSFHTPEEGGGFYWYHDTDSNREVAMRTAREEEYDNVVVITASLRVVNGYLADDITEILDRQLTFESGHVGHILYKRGTFTSQLS